MLKQATLLQAFLDPIVHRVSAEKMAENLPPKLEVLLSLRMPRALEDLYEITRAKVSFHSFQVWRVLHIVWCGGAGMCSILPLCRMKVCHLVRIGEYLHAVASAGNDRS